LFGFYILYKNFIYYPSDVAQNYGELFPMHIAFSVTTVLSQEPFKDNSRVRDTTFLKLCDTVG